MSLSEQLRELGALTWVEGPSRAWLESPECLDWIERGMLAGAILPAMARQAERLQDREVRARLRPLTQSGLSPERAIEAWIVDEARVAADAFLPLFERTSGHHGWVSVPTLGLEDVDGLQRLWSEINRPNVVLQLPSSHESMQTYEAALVRGVNVHLIDVYSLERCAEALEAFLRALESRRAGGASVDHVTAALSPAVERLAEEADHLLDRAAGSHPEVSERATALRGQTAAALARLMYAQWRAAVDDDRFQALAVEGAHPLRLVWRMLSGSGETGVPGPAFAAPQTALAIPHALLFQPGPESLVELEGDLSIARAQIDGLLRLGISLAAVSERIEREALRSSRRQETAFLRLAGRQLIGLQRELGPLGEQLRQSLEALRQAQVGRRLWQRDPSLWSEQPESQGEVRWRLGWLDLPSEAATLVPALQAFAGEVRVEGLRHAVLLGTGGSSLAADVLRRILAREDAVDFHVLDTTDPEAVLSLARRAPIRETLYLVASKSGTTVEPLALMEHFWVEALRRVGREAGRHFVAITDPGTPLEALARDRAFRRVFTSPPEVGGRYSALSIFGLLPAALMAIDLTGLLRGAARMAHACRPGADPKGNPGLFLGAALSAAAAQGLNHVTFLSDPGLAPLEDWIEQLLAESSGKEGRGLLPIIGEPPGPAAVYRQQPRLMVYLRRDGAHDARLRSWTRAGLPVIVVEVDDGPAGLGAEFFRWEVATAVACHRLGVNAFDQPDVQRAKNRTAELLKSYHRKGFLPELPVVWEGSGIRLVGQRGREKPLEGAGLDQVAGWLLARARPGEALALLLYLSPTPTLARTLSRARRAVRDRWGVTVTPGIGPRYLHSTGQLHKGGPAGLVYVIVTAGVKRNLPIPEAGYTFGTLVSAQALGDLQALLALGRRAFGVHLDRPARAAEFLAALAAAQPPRGRKAAP
ncbi:MAG: transaldolase family protein [Chloroflexota bacterium]